MEKYISARSDRTGKWQALQSSYEKAAGVLESQWKKIEEGHQELQVQKEQLAVLNGGTDVSNTDILDINAGGQIVRVSRGTLTQIKGSRLEALFSGRWEKQLHRDANGRIFLDVNPSCFRCIVDYLNELKIAPPDNPPDLPRAVQLENQVVLDGLLTAFGLSLPVQFIDSVILTDTSHVRALTGFLAEDHLGKELTLLYRGTRDGFGARYFHEKCDDQGPTLTVVKSGDYTFGGFSDLAWTSGRRGYEDSNAAFLFGLLCYDGTSPVKMRLKDGPSDAIYQNEDRGPSFGAGLEHDLCFYGDATGHECIGSSYSLPPGSSSYYFTGDGSFTIKEIEVFRVSGKPPPPATDTNQSLSLDAFPKDIQSTFQEEEKTLLEASDELSELQEAFSKEQAAVHLFCQGADDEVVLLNVSGQSMAVKHSTLAKYPDSVLYKQFADPNWGGATKTRRPSGWDAKKVVAWTKKIHGLTEDISSQFQDVNGAELLALEREDIKDLGIQRPGTVALIAKSIHKLRDEENEKTATFIEHSDYCFGKILDHMRLKAMSDLDVPDPSSPEIREPDRKRFKRIVEYYFPNKESASHFLG